MISSYKMSLHLSCYESCLVSVFHSSMKNNLNAIFSCNHESLIFASNKTDFTSYYYDIQKQLCIYQNNVKQFDLHSTVILFLIMDKNLLLSVFLVIVCLPNASKCINDLLSMKKIHHKDQSSISFRKTL